jgi:hypothetical protein
MLFRMTFSHKVVFIYESGRKPVSRRTFSHKDMIFARSSSDSTILGRSGSQHGRFTCFINMHFYESRQFNLVSIYLIKIVYELRR